MHCIVFYGNGILTAIFSPDKLIEYKLLIYNIADNEYLVIWPIDT